MAVERRKRNAYAPSPALPYIWYTYTGAELDYVEDLDRRLADYEFQLTKKASQAPASWLANYPEANYAEINRDNHLDFML